MRSDLIKADYLFVGAGASATLLLLSMERRGLLADKSIILIEPDIKSKKDKTFCFWATAEEIPALQCRHLISHRWGESSVNRSQPEKLQPLQYLHISSLDVYQESLRIQDMNGMHRIQASVLTMESTDDGVEVKTDSGSWRASVVLDSRPPKFERPAKNEAHLLQSFIGFTVSTERAIESTNCIDLMDFQVDQLGSTQFMYVLPFTANEALVELTRFGQEVLTREEAEPIISQYITERFGSYTILESEIGCIPMSSASLHRKRTPGIIPIGGRAGAIKPSTGYAFKNMARDAEVLAESLEKGKQPSAQPTRSRFQFYDRLLLLILSLQPTQGKPIFQTLFKKNKTSDVLMFLDEKTTPYQDFKILLSLPLKPFLRALWLDTLVRYHGLIKPFAILLTALCLCGLQIAAPYTFDWVQPVLLLLGLFAVGIPHGAVDHLLESGNLKIPVRPHFIFGYLGAIVGYLLFWLAFPNIALSLFLAYSIWHFGQCDLNEWNIRSKGSTKNFAWGALLLGILLFGHVVETNIILDNLAVFLIPLREPEAKSLSMLLVAIAVAWGLWERRAAMLISALMLAVCIQLPLLTSFGLYFLGQHSLNGWSHLKIGLQADNRSLFMKALPFSLGAILLFATLLYFLEIGWLAAFNGHWITAFFVFISCISFPHVIAMHGFYRRFSVVRSRYE